MISLCIPTWEAYGNGTWLLNRCLASIRKQTYKDYEIIVSDNSKNNDIFEFCQGYTLRYLWNPIIGMAANTNNAIKHAKGIIKILYQDDYFVDENSLKDIAENFGTADWMITGCSNNPHPVWTKEIPKGKNTLGSPSCLTMRYPIPMDENLKWILDCKLYERLFNMFGWPKILDKVNVNIGTGEWQETNHLSNELKQAEEHSGSTTND